MVTCPSLGIEDEKPCIGNLLVYTTAANIVPVIPPCRATIIFDIPETPFYSSPT